LSTAPPEERLEAAPARHGRRRAAIKVAVALMLLAALALLATRLPLAAWLLGLVEWARAAGPAGGVVYGAGYSAAVVLMLPGSVLTLGAGFAWGPVGGVLVAVPGSVVGATLAFLLGRTLARGWVERKVDRSPRFRAIDQAVSEQGFRVVVLLRLSPVFPFNLLNYALGLTRVKTGDYVLGSLVGMFPGTVLYVYLGSLLTSASELLSRRAPGGEAAAGADVATSALYWFGLVATVLVTVVIARTARRALAKTLAEQEAR
jgi:uncharacterized membrane protein YdjX (TVP38/TMEM64 family)